jgi:hypothetical protein
MSDELGIIGNGSHQGFLCASCLAVRPKGRRVLGLIGQRLVTRQRVRAGRGRQERRADPHRETRLWSALTQDLPVATAAGTRCVVVADRGADVLEFLDGMAAAGRSFLVRANHNRRINRGTGELDKLFDHVRSQAAVGRRETTIPAAAGRAARTTTLAVAHVAVSVVVPKQPRGEVRGEPLPLHVVRVWETTPPPGVEPLEWVLLTDQPVMTAEDAWERVDWYECRWLIEEFHKGMKTGCGVEQLQVHHCGGLGADHRRAVGVGGATVAAARRRSRPGSGRPAGATVGRCGGRAGGEPVAAPRRATRLDGGRILPGSGTHGRPSEPQR